MEIEAPPVKIEQIECCGASSEAITATERQPLTIEFLYLNLTECGRCKGTNQQLEEALPLITPVLEASGFDVAVRKVHVRGEEQAAALGFVVSPTIRVNDRDIQLKWRETPCDSCSKGCAGEVACREWEYRGQWYRVPPRELIISAILREAYGEGDDRQAARPRVDGVPGNLKQFFSRKLCCEASQ